MGVWVGVADGCRGCATPNPLATFPVPRPGGIQGCYCRAGVASSVVAASRMHLPTNRVAGFAGARVRHPLCVRPSCPFRTQRALILDQGQQPPTARPRGRATPPAVGPTNDRHKIRNSGRFYLFPGRGGVGLRAPRSRLDSGALPTPPQGNGSNRTFFKILSYFFFY